MKKFAVWVVNINNYFPELLNITLPTIKSYASKIRADFNLITERKFPDFPPTYEKVQVHELGKEYSWNILFDADILLHKDLPNFTLYPPDCVSFDAGYEASSRFIPDDYFFRDGRNRGISTYFLAASEICHDIWTPLDISAEETKSRISRWHIADEFCISRNLAKFGLKYVGFVPSEKRWMLQHIGVQDKSIQEKKRALETAIKIMRNWK